MGGVGDASAVVPGPCDHVPPTLLRYRLGGAHRRRPVRAAEIPGRTEYVPLAGLREIGADDERVVRAQGQAPARARIAGQDGQHRLPERRQVELVAAEPARLQDPVEPRGDELPVELCRVMPELLRFVLLRT